MPLQFPAIDAAIAQFEKSNPFYNNPMAVQAGSFANWFGCSGKAGNGLAICPDSQTGLNMGDSLLGSYASKGLNLTDAINKWSGGAPNYPGFVSDKTGVSGDTSLSSLLGLIPGTVGSVASNLTSNASVLNFSISRIVAIILGLILIAGGIYLFKPAQEIVQSAIKTGGKLAA